MIRILAAYFFAGSMLYVAAQSPSMPAIDAAATYELTNVDTGKADRFTGAQLIQDGFKISSPDQPGGPLIQYAKVQN